VGRIMHRLGLRDRIRRRHRIADAVYAPGYSATMIGTEASPVA